MRPDAVPPEVITILDALQVYAERESWVAITRSDSDWPVFEYQGDDGKEYPWELAEDALVALEKLGKGVLS